MVSGGWRDDSRREWRAKQKRSAALSQTLVDLGARPLFTHGMMPLLFLRDLVAVATSLALAVGVFADKITLKWGAVVGGESIGDTDDHFIVELKNWSGAGGDAPKNSECNSIAGLARLRAQCQGARTSTRY
jgi:hypothetical protein